MTVAAGPRRAGARWAPQNDDSPDPSVANDPRLRVPKIARDCDVRSLPLSPVEGFLFSRVDGKLSVEELTEQTGLDAATVQAAITRLSELGALEGEARAAAPVALPPLPNPQVAVAVRDVDVAARPPIPRDEPDDSESSGSFIAPRTREIAAAELARRDAAEDASARCDLEPERRRHILDLYARLDGIDHYTLLGVPRTADKKSVKRAYMRTAAEYHPDRFFGRALGPYGAKLERIFSRLTLAHDVLVTADRRARYDVELARTPPTTKESPPVIARRGSDAVRARASSVPPPIATVNAPLVAQGTRPDEDRNPTPVGLRTPKAPRVPSAKLEDSRPKAPARPQEPAAPAAPPPNGDDERVRRQALAAKLAVGKVAPKARPIDRSATPATPLDLRRVHEAAAKEAAKQPLARYLEAARDAVASGDHAGASNAFRLALSVDPENAEAAAGLESSAQRAAVAGATANLRRAETELTNGHLAEAARFFSRAATGMPDDASVQRKAADALVRSQGDLHKAAELARRAVALVPEDGEARATLVEVYLAANLMLAARRELDALKRLDPKHPRLAALQSRLK